MPLTVIIHSRKPMAKVEYFNEPDREIGKKKNILFIDMMKENGFMISHQTFKKIKTAEYCLIISC